MLFQRDEANDGNVQQDDEQKMDLISSIYWLPHLSQTDKTNHRTVNSTQTQTGRITVKTLFVTA